MLAATIKARWVCEQAHQQFKEEPDLDHFEGQSWAGLHRHALMTMIAYASSNPVASRPRDGKKSGDHHLNRACRPSGKPSLISLRGLHQGGAHTVRNSLLMPRNLNCQNSAKLLTLFHISAARAAMILTAAVLSGPCRQRSPEGPSSHNDCNERIVAVVKRPFNGPS